MLANPLGFRGYNRLTPQDGFNLNRVFPGDPAGHLSQQLAHRLLELSLEHSDVMLDLHSGGDLTITCHYTLFHNDGTRGRRGIRAPGPGTGTPNVWNSLEPFLSGAHFANYTKRGKPSLIVESGGGARVTAGRSRSADGRDLRCLQGAANAAGRAAEARTAFASAAMPSI